MIEAIPTDVNLVGGDPTIQPKVDCNEIIHVFYSGKSKCECGKYIPIKANDYGNN